MLQEDKKRIAVNTVVLYIRMIVIMLVSLFTSRKVLEVLGVDDYGIMNVVGGVVSMMAFLNGSMTVATQRFLTYELGRKDTDRYRRVFSMSMFIHLIIAGIILFLCETAGLWMVNSVLNIPSDRMAAANVVYQASILSLIFGIVQTPYTASVISHENMGFYAYMSIAGAVMKLLIVYLLLTVPYDSLAVYAILLLCVNMLMTAVYSIYCRVKYAECHIAGIWDRGIFRSMVSFTGWNMFGTVAWILKDQGINILMNLFSGPAVNAARGVSMQVSASVKNLISGFQTAVNPQITKSYAGGNIQDMHKLMFTSSKVSFFLFLVLALPIAIETPYILNLWLKDVPEYSVLFTRIIIVEALADTLSGPFITGLMATGIIRWYQIVIGSLIILNIPVSYLLLKAGCPIETPLIISLSVTVISIAGRAIFAKFLAGVSLRSYLRSVIFPVAAVVVLSGVLPVFQSSCMDEGFIRLVATTLTSLLSVSAVSYLVGLDRNEKAFVVAGLRSIKTRLGGGRN